MAWWVGLTAALLVTGSGAPRAATAGLAESQPAAAPSTIEGRPGSSWGEYNQGVTDYKEGRFQAAFERWQNLTLHPLPRGLRDPVGFQLGNAQFRLGEPLEAEAPEQAAEWWRRSLEAYRSLLERSPRHSDARHNLALVQHRLARLTHRLGKELFDKAEGEAPDAAIDLLRLSTAQLNEAVALAPQESAPRADRDRAENRLRQREVERAAQSEAKGDQLTQQNSSWADANAEQQYRHALEDLDDAARPTVPAEASAAQPAAAPSPERQSTDRQVAQARERVSRKLADLLARVGQREQKNGNEAARYDPDEALEHYEQALEEFAAAQQVQPDHAAAQRGEREVRQALEQLLVKRGKEQLEEGREMLGRNSPQAAQPLTAALSNFESAQNLNPGNQEAQAGAEEAKRLLPEALVKAGQREMAAGDRAEAQMLAEALSRYQSAETSFQQALELKPGQSQAQQGLAEVEPKLARLRDQLEKQAEAEAKQVAKSGRKPAKLQDLLGQVSEREQERPRDTDRRRQRAQKQTGGPKNPLDW